MTRQELNELLGEALVEWATAERERKGDRFATERDLENIKSEPLAFGDLLKGEDAYDFLRRVLAVQKRHEDRVFWRMLSFLTDDGYRLHYDAADGKWTDGDLEFEENAEGLPVHADGTPLAGHFTNKEIE